MAEASHAGDSADKRPLSPHLQIYKPTITMTMSILHRITGAGLYFGTLILVWWLAAAAGGASAFDTVRSVLGSPLGLLVLFGFTWALFHHMFGGLRHFVWDTGSMMDKRTASKLAWACLVAALVLTLAVWAIGFLVAG